MRAVKIEIYKKVLLHERKRHTTCHVASTRSTVLSWRGGGTPVPAGGVPQSWERTWDWGTPGKGPGIRDLGKNLGLGYTSLWTDTHLWKHYFPHPSDADRKNKFSLDKDENRKNLFGSRLWCVGTARDRYKKEAWLWGDDTVSFELTKMTSTHGQRACFTTGDIQLKLNRRLLYQFRNFGIDPNLFESNLPEYHQQRSAFWRRRLIPVRGPGTQPDGRDQSVWGLESTPTNQEVKVPFPTQFMSIWLKLILI